MVAAVETEALGAFMALAVGRQAQRGLAVMVVKPMEIRMVSMVSMAAMAALEEMEQ